MNYYHINEDAARRANDAYSHSDYTAGSATTRYKRMADEAITLANVQKAHTDPMYHDKIDALLERYCRKLAENINHLNEIDARVPSVLIAGGSNFPVRAKEKQNAARDRNMEEYNYIQELLDKIRSTGTGTRGISSDDPQAIDRLKEKLAELEADQQTMKAVNAYYRKNKTFEGCPDISAENAAEIETQWAAGRYKGIPFPSFSLSNNNANIKRVRGRIADLEKKAAKPAKGWEFDGGSVVANIEANRLQINFDEKPDEAAQAELKGRGFRWAPSQGAWQRQLTNNAIYSAKQIKFLRPKEATT